MQLATRFASRSPVLRPEHPLSDEQIRAVAPSIFAEAPHESRSERYSYIPTTTVLRELRGEGLQPSLPRPVSTPKSERDACPDNMRYDKNYSRVTLNLLPG